MSPPRQNNGTYPKASEYLLKSCLVKTSTDRLIDQARTRLELNIQARTALNKYFTSWIDHHRKQKDKWGELVKYRYLIGRMKLNKVFWAWKIKVRQAKVQRLKQSIIEHQVYKDTLRACFREWKAEVFTYKDACKRLIKAYKSGQKRETFMFLKYRARDMEAKERQAATAQIFITNNRVIKGYTGLVQNIAL